MSNSSLSRRTLLKAAGAVAGGSLLAGCKQSAMSGSKDAVEPGGPADYTLTIAVTPLELSPNRIISTTTYNGQFPGPLLRLKEGQKITVDIHNQTDTPEQLHWHGQFLSTDVDGNLLALFEAQQRPWKLAVVRCGGDDSLGRDFKRTGCDPDRVVSCTFIRRGCVGFLVRGFGETRPEQRATRQHASRLQEMAPGNHVVVRSILCRLRSWKISGFTLVKSGGYD